MIAQTPPMGWNSWDCYGISVNEEEVRKNAEYMAKNLKQYGYEYIVIDGEWWSPDAEGHDFVHFTPVYLDEYSRLIPSEDRFPSSKGNKGLKPLVDYIHSLGLKVGLHIMRGIPRQAVHNDMAIKNSDKKAKDIVRIYSTLPLSGDFQKTDAIVRVSNTAFWNTTMYGVSPFAPGSREYYQSIFELYASWGIDMIRCDDIDDRLNSEEYEYRLIHDTLRECGRDMVFSITPGYPGLEHADLLKETANTWHIALSFWDRWDYMLELFIHTALWSNHAGAGHWPDADSLPIGPVMQDYDIDNYQPFNLDEKRTMFSLWCILRSPLMIGGILMELTKEDYDLITNEAILKMHKNARHSHQVWRRNFDHCEHILWSASDITGGTYILLFNIGENASNVTLSLDELDVPGPVVATDLWDGTKENFDTAIPFSLEHHGVKVYHLSYDM